MGQHEYLLSTDSDEIERLRFQHAAWHEQLYALWQRAGLKSGMRALDLGCGPGFASVDLAGCVGPAGSVLALDQNPGFLALLAAEREHQGLSWIELCRARAEAPELAEATLDFAYSRWLLCWLADAAPAVEAVSRALRPGAAFALHEYVDWATLRLVPRAPAMDRAVEACMESWRAGGATIDIAERMPALAAGAGLVVEHLQPLARCGQQGSLEWRWIGEFLHSYLPKVVARGLLSEAQREDFEGAWRSAARAGSWCFTPTVAAIVLRKPAH